MNVDVPTIGTNNNNNNNHNDDDYCNHDERDTRTCRQTHTFPRMGAFGQTRTDFVVEVDDSPLIVDDRFRFEAIEMSLPRMRMSRTDRGSLV